MIYTPISRKYTITNDCVVPDLDFAAACARPITRGLDFQPGSSTENRTVHNNISYYCNTSLAVRFLWAIRTVLRSQAWGKKKITSFEP